ncbi:MAG: DNA polymerase III subunit delta' [Streptosporangiaceae bacterium]
MTVFDELVGQERVVDELRAAAAAGDAQARGGSGSGMTHAWLLTGPPGSGRSNAARAFAAALQCREGGCGRCPDCHQVLAGTHADVEVVRPSGLSYSVRETRSLVLRAGQAPTRGRFQIVLFEDADRATEQAANALLKAIEEPGPRTVWLLCTPSPDDLVTTIRSRCRLVSLRTPPASAVAEVLVHRDGVDREVAAFAARASQGHIGRARRLATDERARLRREEVLRIPLSLGDIGACLEAAARLVSAAADEAGATTQEADARETTELRQALGEGGSRKSLPRGSAAPLRDLEERQKSRATRVKRDSLDRALLDLASFYRDVLCLQLGANVALANAERTADLRAFADRTSLESTLRRLDAITECRTRLDANANPQLAVEAMTLALRAG